MKILVLGRGWLGTRLARDLPGASLALAGIDISNRENMRAVIADERPDVVINAAGKTGRPNVDWCEAHQAETWRSNVIGALNVADVCQAHGAYLLHLGSGCIFNGPSPPAKWGGWREDDYANPEGFYARTKYAADLVLEPMPHVAIVRLRMPIDGTPHPRNLITKLAGYSKVIDVVNSVTVVDDLVAVVKQLIEKRAEGVFHTTNPGVVQHREIVAHVPRAGGPSYNPEMISSAKLETVAPRSNCILASPRLEALGIRMRPAQEAVRDAMVKYAAARRTT